jgi:mono/diheme cytochrome c family protein
MFGCRANKTLKLSARAFFSPNWASLQKTALSHAIRPGGSALRNKQSIYRTFPLALFVLLVLGAPLARAETGQAAKRIDYNRSIRPIFSDTCFACHGPDAETRMANLRLDTKDGGAFEERDGHRLIVPGDSASSRLFQKINSKDDAERMPPPTSGMKLTEKQIELIKQWIDEGAKWESHWAFEPPQRLAQPVVKQKEWVRNPIDSFVLARLEQEGLKPAHEADKVTLLRRLTLDLTGLPPTPQEVDSYLADRSSDAYEKRVDQLLASPHYGERMAQFWLDLARYSDTHGYHIDSERNMWPWRDWVIRAFNRNMPFDEFTIEQIAGDLLPNATLDQKVATGFNRNHMINYEGGAIPEEYQNEYVVDRVEATSTAWMALTMGCARCHDHKYDPVSQKDFYRFYAFFNNIPEKGLDGFFGNADPVVQLPTPEQASTLDELKTKIAHVKDQLPEKDVSASEASWTKTALETIPRPPNDGLVAHYEFDGHLADTAGGHHHGRTVRGEVTFGMGQVAKDAEFNGETDLVLGDVGDFDRDQPFSIAAWINQGGGLEHVGRTIIQKMDATPAQTGYEISHDQAQSVGDMQRGSYWFVRLVHQWPDSAIQLRTKRRLKSPFNDSGWRHLVVNYDGSGKASGLRVYNNGKLEEMEVIKDYLTGSFRNSSPLEIGGNQIGNPFKGFMDDLRLYKRQLSEQEIEQLDIHEPIRALLGVPSKACADAGAAADDDDSGKDPLYLQTLVDDKIFKAKNQCKAERTKLREYYLTWAAPQNVRQLQAQLKDLEKEKTDLEKKIPTSMVMKEMETPRETYILKRGDYRGKTEKVTSGTPSVLPPLPKGTPPSRLALARWLVRPDHPLTSRVAVNRFWQLYFGLGLVKTAENFGSQGESPSNPQLLDWLATEFIRTGWDVKGMQKLIVTSATYRQSSAVSKEMIEKDPENRLLAHGPRFRLSAEAVRDNALAVSGLLNPEIGGRSVYPYQPKGLWEEMAIGEVFTAQSYSPSHGKDLYRRSLYTFWKRTVPPPSMATFDAPDREKCTARRLLTNTPLQALVLMNDPTYVEAARALASRTLEEVNGNSAKRIRYAFRLATAREPEPQEVKILEQQAQQELARYRHNRAEAEKLIKVGESPIDPKLKPAELAAWTMVASTILNLDETMTKE